MEIFRIKQLDSMGFMLNEEFFITQDKAEKRFNKIMEEYENNENLASDEDAEDYLVNNVAIEIIDTEEECIKRAIVCLWDKCGYESDDWDIVAEHLELEKIEIKE